MVSAQNLSNPSTRLERWPAVRPDDIVPKVVFKATVQGSNNKEDFDTAITARTKWTRGLRDTGEASLVLMLSTFVSQVSIASHRHTYPGRLAGK